MTTLCHKFIEKSRTDVIDLISYKIYVSIFSDQMVSMLDLTRRLRDFRFPLKILTNEQKVVTPGFWKKAKEKKKSQNGGVG